MKLYVITMPPGKPKLWLEVYSANTLEEAIMFVSNFAQQRAEIDDEAITYGIKGKGSVCVGHNFGGTVITENIFIMDHLPHDIIDRSSKLF